MIYGQILYHTNCNELHGFSPTAVRQPPPDKLMHPPGRSYNQHCANNRRCNNRKPVIPDDSKALHQANTCRNEEESEILDKKISYSADPFLLNYSSL